MSDLIDRQAAIEAMRKAKDKSEAHRMLVQLPPAQPTDWNGQERTGTDLISRQTAQRLFGKALTYKEQQGKLTWTTVEVKQFAADFIEDLPSAQPELIEKTAYIRGFEQGRMQGMIDSQGGKK